MADEIKGMETAAGVKSTDTGAQPEIFDLPKIEAEVTHLTQQCTDRKDRITGIINHEDAILADADAREKVAKRWRVPPILARLPTDLQAKPMETRGATLATHWAKKDWVMHGRRGLTLLRPLEHREEAELRAFEHEIHGMPPPQFLQGILQEQATTHTIEGHESRVTLNYFATKTLNITNDMTLGLHVENKSRRLISIIHWAAERGRGLEPLLHTLTPEEQQALPRGNQGIPAQTELRGLHDLRKLLARMKGTDAEVEVYRRRVTLDDKEHASGHGANPYADWVEHKLQEKDLADKMRMAGWRLDQAIEAIDTRMKEVVKQEMHDLKYDNRIINACKKVIIRALRGEEHHLDRTLIAEETRMRAEVLPSVTAEDALVIRIHTSFLARRKILLELQQLVEKNTVALGEVAKQIQTAKEIQEGKLHKINPDRLYREIKQKMEAIRTQDSKIAELAGRHNTMQAAEKELGIQYLHAMGRVEDRIIEVGHRLERVTEREEEIKLPEAA